MWSELTRLRPVASDHALLTSPLPPPFLIPTRKQRYAQQELSEIWCTTLRARPLTSSAVVRSSASSSSTKHKNGLQGVSRGLQDSELLRDHH